MRKLGADEAALWAKVVATVEPLSRDPATREPTKSLKKMKVPPPRGDYVPPRPKTPAKPPSVVPTSGGLDGGWDKRLSQGRVAPDRVIDLHGHRLDDAWEAIDRGLGDAIASGDRLVLLITGHPPKGAPPVERGRIRAAVHDWLGASRHSGQIATVRGAHQRHGGRGALYVVLRRQR
ncbi:Smr/MutS family protein [Sphingomicrobium marinum]|uniref:Smr/MutS family protein n=1 Tax=Sphingomicrobium marinum TaxID=1227950 RepID=UPI00223EE4AD|nr:Smr/MutS family protein [Sphingomicrobium marinum]